MVIVFLAKAQTLTSPAKLALTDSTSTSKVFVLKSISNVMHTIQVRDSVLRVAQEIIQKMGSAVLQGKWFKGRSVWESDEEEPPLLQLEESAFHSLKVHFSRIVEMLTL